MARPATNPFNHYQVFYTPGGAPVRVSIKLDDGPTRHNQRIAGYLNFMDLPDERLPPDEQSPTSGYIVKHIPVSRLETVLDLLHRQIDLLKRPMVIACAVDQSGTLRTALATVASPENVEEERFFRDFPSISFLVPDTVDRDWEGTVEIHGKNFDSGSFALFNGKVPTTIFKTESLLEAQVTKDITGTAGTQKVMVHTGAGSLSNEVYFTVK